MTDLQGVGVTPRRGVGTVVWYDREVELPDRPAPGTVEPDDEWAAFEMARDRAREALADERERARERVGEDEAAVFDVHTQFLDDPQITDGVQTAIEEGVPAAHAIAEVFDSHIDQFESTGGRTAERADDLRDVRDRLLGVLTGGGRQDLGSIPPGSVVLARRLTPSDTAGLDPERVAGIATVAGGRTAHAAIFARALAIPAIVGIGDRLHSIEAGTTVLVDGESGTLTVDPGEGAGASGEGRTPIRDEPVSTADGREIGVAANVGGTRELEPAAQQGADGIGLYRSEFLFLDRSEPPTEAEQYGAVCEALSTFPGERVVVRTLDVGGDKPVEYLDLPAEDNPFLGRRGIRLSLSTHREHFETQLRALLRAAGSEHGDGLAVMVPMVSTVAELAAVLEAVETVGETLEAEDRPYAIPELGVMIETPAAVFHARELAARVDFLSIGTNDLTQYVMAASRESEALGELYDPLQPAVLRAIDRTVEGGHAEGVWVGVCGEMAGDPALTELLVGLGVDELSTSAVTVPEVKAAVAATDTGTARKLADHALAAGTVDEVRDRL